MLIPDGIKETASECEIRELVSEMRRGDIYAVPLADGTFGYVRYWGTAAAGLCSNCLLALLAMSGSAGAERWPWTPSNG
jgi:hypothetical protein